MKCFELVRGRDCRTAPVWFRHTAFGQRPYCTRHKTAWQKRNTKSTGTLWSKDNATKRSWLPTGFNQEMT